MKSFGKLTTRNERLREFLEAPLYIKTRDHRKRV